MAIRPTQPSDSPRPSLEVVSGHQNGPTEECRLVERAIGGDGEAFGELYDRHAARVYRHIFYIIGSGPEAEDLTAQTFLQAWEAIGRYQMRGAPFISWLLRIAHNLAVSHLRSRREKTQLSEGLVDNGHHGDPEHAVEQMADEQRVRNAILHLRDEQRQVIILRFVEDLGYQEVAAIIGKSIPAIRVIQHRALTALRRQMQMERPGQAAL